MKIESQGKQIRIREERPDDIDKVRSVIPFESENI